MESTDSIFRSKIPSIWRDYEPRESQILMSSQIQNTLTNGGSLIIEAGTGVGKSLAYLIPAILHSLENKELVVVSTETKALQDQLIKKDIPLVEKILGVEIRAEIAMGASNYLCKRKLGLVEEQGSFDVDVLHQLDNFQSWVKNTKTGIRSEYNGNLPYDFWMKVSRESDNCLGKACKNFSHSFYFLEKEKWKNANVLIVNHSLLSSHMAGNFRLLPEFKRLIIDEAHNFPEIVGKSFQSEVTFEGVSKLLNYLHSKDNKNSLLGRIHYPQALIESTEESKNSLANLFGMTAQELGLNFFGPIRIQKPLKLDEGKLEDSINRLILQLQEKMEKYSKESEIQEEKEIALGIEMSVGRLKSLTGFFYELRKRTNPNLVFWSEPPRERKKERFIRLLSEPINVDEIISQELLPKLEASIFTSATLTSGKKNFGYFEKQLGFSAKTKLELQSPFDYNRQAILYIPRTIRDPKENDAGYHEDLILHIEDLIRLTEGKCFVLFTSNKSLNTVRQALERKLPYPIFSQTVLGALGAKKSFLETPNSVLFGVNSFWQGVDIKGDQLRSVIIAKLPFQVPTEPVLQTKMEVMKKNNQDPFRDFQMPRASILLKQGFGRLIRSTTDTGIVSILDPRIHTKSYGKQFLSCFPEGIKTVILKEELIQKYHNLPKLIL